MVSKLKKERFTRFSYQVLEISKNRTTGRHSVKQELRVTICR